MGIPSGHQGYGHTLRTSELWARHQGYGHTLRTSGLCTYPQDIRVMDIPSGHQGYGHTLRTSGLRAYPQDIRVRDRAVYSLGTSAETSCLASNKQESHLPVKEVCLASQSMTSVR